ncbi:MULTISPECIES: hypothetical protein [unclassified Nocardioides]|uniref:hypothetical protein n=1 Tax=unclassified Nocardioides TaxID=2615069 RepID=UPI00005707A5|nr:MULTISPECIES: hypothetical protein [unclassified Nocardioides]ABL84124.1 hypothetical protein Noca_4629 [Nocardioides sp. JS614]
MNAGFDALLDALVATAQASDDVVGLVAFGSTADRSRTDAGSDHDFAWITVSGAAPRWRRDPRWLPDSDRIVLHVIEHHGGVKVIYEDGHRLEFGVAELHDFATWAGAPARALVGGDAVEAAVRQVVARRPEGAPDAARSARLFVTQLLSGMERYHRGELLSASGLIRGEAVEHLLRTVTLRLPGDLESLDPLDPRRRFELVHPRLADRIEHICRQPLDVAGSQLLDLAVEELSPAWAEFPHAAVAAARRRVAALG